MKNHFDFKDIMTFGLFLLALLTFVFTFCRKTYIEKPPQNFDQRGMVSSILINGQPTLVGGCSFYAFTVTQIIFICKNYFYFCIFTLLVPSILFRYDRMISYHKIRNCCKYYLSKVSF